MTDNTSSGVLKLSGEDGDMTFFEQVEVTAKLSKVSCKRPLNSTEKTAFGLIFTLCEEGKKLENAKLPFGEGSASADFVRNGNLRNRGCVRKDSGWLIDFFK